MNIIALNFFFLSQIHYQQYLKRSRLKNTNLTLLVNKLYTYSRDINLYRTIYKSPHAHTHKKHVHIMKNAPIHNIDTLYTLLTILLLLL